MTLDQCCKKLLIKEPFYGLFLLGLNKYYGDKCQTACVLRNGINTELCVNKEFWDTLDDDTQLGVLKHELGHILFKHLFMLELFDEPTTFNYASDCEVNSYIPVLQKDPYVYPARYRLQNGLGTLEYYKKIPVQQSQGGEGNGGGTPLPGGQKPVLGGQNPGQNNQGGGQPQQIDDHSFWKDFSDLSDAEKQLVSQQIDHMAKHTAEQVQKLAGSVPGELKGYIDSLFKQKPAVFNWKAYFRRLLGTAIETNLKKSRKKESRRFPEAPGLKHKHKHSILVAIDTSGSVSDAELCDFFSEITHIYKAGAAVEILEFDHGIQRHYPYQGKWDGSISGRGGTEFSEPIRWFNERKNLYSAFVLFTDGYASTENLRPAKEMIWIITSSGDKSNNYPGKVIFIPENNE